MLNQTDLVIFIIFQVFVKIRWISNWVLPLFRHIKLNISENLCIRNRYNNIVLNHFSRVWLFATLWTVAHRLLCPWRFSRQKYWVGLPCLPSGDLLSGTEPTNLCLLHWQAGSLPLVPPGKPYNNIVCVCQLLSSVWLCDPMDCSPPDSYLCLWNPPGKKTEVGSHSIL